MNHRKIFMLLALTLISAFLFAGCSSAFDGLASESKSEVYELGQGSDYSSNYMPGGIDYEDISLSLTSSKTGDNAPSVPAERKIIRDAVITMEVSDSEKSYENIVAKATSLGGYETGGNIRGGESYNDGSPTVSATLKIPAAKLDDFITELKKEGKIISLDTSSSDITSQYYDAEIRLKTLEETLENYREFLRSATDIDEQLRITRYINDTTTEIEQIKGSLRLWDSLVDYSTVKLYLYRPYEAPVPERKINWNSLSLDDMGWFISSGFLGVCSIIYSLFQWIIIIIVVASPIIVPAAVLLFILIRRDKKKKKKMQEEQMRRQMREQENAKNPTDNNNNAIQ